MLPDIQTAGVGPGTLMMTTEGQVPVEWLSATHRLVTECGGSVAVRVVRKKALHQTVTFCDPLSCAPPLVAGAGQRVLLAGHDVERQFGFDAGLASLTDLPGMASRSARTSPLYPIQTSRSCAVSANGYWIEVRSTPGLDDPLPAYPILARWEALLLDRQRAPAVWSQIAVAV